MELQTPTIPLGPTYNAWTEPGGSRLIIKRDGSQAFWRPAEELVAQSYQDKDIYFELEDLSVLHKTPLVLLFKQTLISMSGVIFLLAADAGAWLMAGETIPLPNRAGSYVFMGKVLSHEIKLPLPLSISVVRVSNDNHPS